jgi:chromosome segregation ATPase
VTVQPILLQTNVGETRVVSASEVESLSRKGWRLVAIVPVQEVTKLELPEDSSSGRHDIYRMKPSKDELAISAHYVMARPHSETLDELTSKVSEIEWQCTALREERDGADKKSSEALKREADAIARAKHLQDQVDHGLRTVDTLTKSLRKIEGDLAKVREAVGTQRMKEILE